MHSCVSLLRGINVGNKVVDMPGLRRIFSSLGAEKVETYLRSGNVIFYIEEGDRTRLKGAIEDALLESLGYGVKVFIGSAADLRRVVDGVPFTGTDAGRMHVTFLSATPAHFPAGEVDAVRSEGEDYRFSGHEIYLYCPGGYGRTRLSNWRSVCSLLPLAEKSAEQV